MDELVKDKERANFCDYFSVVLISGAGAGGTNAGTGVTDKAAKARAAFDALFK